MLGTYYYHEIIRKTIISFGTLFNAIEIKHKEQDGTTFSEMNAIIRVQTFLMKIHRVNPILSYRC